MIPTKAAHITEPVFGVVGQYDLPGAENSLEEYFKLF
jgi:hypothetical protein